MAGFNAHIDTGEIQQYAPSEMPFEHLLNADFDLSMRPRWRWPEGETAERRITDLQWHALFLAEAGDSVVVPEPAPGDFVGYLEDHGAELPVLTVDPDCRAEQTLSPFGWGAVAAERNHRHERPAEHPPLEVVSQVNGRRFSAELEAELFGGEHTAAVLSSETELRATLKDLPDEGGGWVLKAEHGNAGLGNRRLCGTELSNGDVTAVRRFFGEDEGAVFERWRPRLLDLCATFSVNGKGKPTRFGLHEMINTANGALIGSLFHENATHLDRWRSAMAEATQKIARSLADAGYFGPACMDAFVWEDEGRSRLRPLVDLNARREMSAGASALWRRLGGRGTAYWRFYTRRKIELPGSYQELVDALGDDAYDPTHRRGVLVTSPLWLGPDRRTPVKAALLFLAEDRDGALTLDARFRKRFER